VPELAELTDNQIIREQVDRILDSGVLGRSRFYTALLTYLADCADRDHVPKEIEIAAEVFDRGNGFDPAQDSMVRVYAHNLRQKLVQYYAEHDAEESRQISIPKGEYRITLGAAAPNSDPAETGRARPRRLAVAVIVAVSIVVGMAIDRMLTTDAGAVSAAYRDIARSALWAPVVEGETPITVVVGDYYIFGEMDEFGNVGRLVREFSINSSADLDNRFMLEPETADRYIDLDLTYLPSSIAFAMRDLMGVLAVADKDIRVVAMSKLDSSIIRESHVVYLGYLSGLGMLTDFVFEGSELALGETFDELIHLPTGASFISEAGMPSGRQSYRDYGLFSTLPAPGGNQFVFIAGMRDEGLMQTANAVSDVATVRMSIEAVSVGGVVPPAFELVYEVAGLGRTNLDATIVHAAPLAIERVAVGLLGP
jgi:hypothetical protein